MNKITERVFIPRSAFLCSGFQFSSDGEPFYYLRNRQFGFLSVWRANTRRLSNGRRYIKNGNPALKPAGFNCFPKYCHILIGIPPVISYVFSFRLPPDKNPMSRFRNKLFNKKLIFKESYVIIEKKRCLENGFSDAQRKGSEIEKSIQKTPSV